MAVGAVLAYLSRNIPESFNESKYIAFSVIKFSGGFLMCFKGL
jgi:hypothetical protein